ncbi:MAG TPA: response regulator [Candidatus Acidoferrum sp.]|nr:response regulator [Candidatus Acidoferrum sp.]
MARAETKATVFVVDDDPSVRKSLARLMKSAGYAVETFTSAREFLDHAHYQDAAGCLLLDVQLPGLNGLDLQQELKQFAFAPSVIFITGHGDVPTSVRAMKDGAVDFLTKPVNDDDLLWAVRQAIARNTESRQREAELIELRRRVDTLTSREREVMALIVRGFMNKQVAAMLGTVEKTIKVHRGRVIEKMEVQSLAELVRAAEKLGLFSDANESGSARPTATARLSSLSSPDPRLAGHP